MFGEKNLQKFVNFVNFVNFVDFYGSKEDSKFYKSLTVLI